MDFKPITQLVKKKYGIAISPDSQHSLSQAVKKRMACKEFDSFPHYLTTLERNADELCRLAGLLTNNESYFFREGPHFNLCTEKLVPEIRDRKPGLVRMVSAGCATGEEPYSLAIALTENFGREFLSSVSIVGCDIDRNAIKKARGGVYTKHSFRGRGFINSQKIL